MRKKAPLSERGINERFNGTLRNEHLDIDQLYGLLDAQVKVGMFRDYYNNERLHSSLGYKTPTEFKAWVARGDVAVAADFASKPSASLRSALVLDAKSNDLEALKMKEESSYRGNVST